MPVPLASQQFRWTLTHTLGVLTAHEPPMVQEELQQRQGVRPELATQEEGAAQPAVEVLDDAAGTHHPPQLLHQRFTQQPITRTPALPQRRLTLPPLHTTRRQRQHRTGFFDHRGRHPEFFGQGLHILVELPSKGQQFVALVTHSLAAASRWLGSVHNILHHAVAEARRRNAQHHLAGVRIGAHDEIFQAARPVLVGADVASTCCYLLCPEEHRDADTWGVRLLELTQRGFCPDATIADAATGLRAGQAQALPGVPCRGDVFHALQTATPLVGYLDNRAYDAIATRSRLEGRQARSEHRHGRKDASLASQLRYARVAEAQAVALAEEVAALIGWLRHDVLAVRGPDYASRCALYD